jgi:hypothetical protein
MGPIEPLEAPGVLVRLRLLTLSLEDTNREEQDSCSLDELDAAYPLSVLLPEELLLSME